MSKVLIINEIPTSPVVAAAHNQVRRLSGHGTTALQYQARRLAETLSGSVKGPKRVPLSFRQHPDQSDNPGVYLICFDGNISEKPAG